MGWNIAERRPRLDEIRVMGEPAARERSSLDGHTLHLARLLRTDGEGLRQLGVMRCPARRHEVLQDRGERALGQVLVDHDLESSWTLRDLSRRLIRLGSRSAWRRSRAAPYERLGDTAAGGVSADALNEHSLRASKSARSSRTRRNRYEEVRLLRLCPAWGRDRVDIGRARSLLRRWGHAANVIGVRGLACEPSHCCRLDLSISRQRVRLLT